MSTEPTQSTGIFSSITNAIGITKQADTKESLEAERMKCNKDIDARLKTLQDAATASPATASPATASPATASPVDAATASPVNGMGGGRKRTKRSTKRSRRSKRSKKSRRTRR